jgi:mannose-6-phosphate isomerase-like protein (cupin superfamily)
MRTLALLVVISLVSFVKVMAQDPTKVDPKHYKVLLDNAHLRIDDVMIKPGEKTPMHSHPGYAVYALTGGNVKFTYPDGKTRTVKVKAGQAIWRDGETHTSENIGKSDLHVIDIELKK